MTHVPFRFSLLALLAAPWLYASGCSSSKDTSPASSASGSAGIENGSSGNMSTGASGGGQDAAAGLGGSSAAGSPNGVAGSAGSTGGAAGVGASGAAGFAEHGDGIGPLVNFCERFTKQICEYDAQCQHQDATSCAARAAIFCDRNGFSDQLTLLWRAVQKGELGFDPTKIADCLTAPTLERYCTFSDLFRISPSCSAVLPGKVPLGGACDGTARWGSTALNECAEGYCAGDTCPSTCMPYPKINEPCTKQRQCDPDGYCDNTGVCRPKTPLNGACTGPNDGSCGNEIHLSVCLSVDTTSSTFTCQAQRLASAGCRYDTECLSYSCSTAHTCASSIANGNPCFFTYSCAADQACLHNGSGSSCGALPGMGSPCSRANQAACAKGFVCTPPTAMPSSDNGICQPTPVLGQPCVDRKCAPGLWCDFGPHVAHEICKTQSGKDGPCGPNAMALCAPDLFCNAATNTCKLRATKGQYCEKIAANACAEGFFCSDEGVCRMERQLGDPCSSSAPCTPGLYCGSTGMCQLTKSVGEHCASDQECVYQNLGCDRDKKTCIGYCPPR